MRYSVGIDIGGTNVKFVLLKNLSILKKIKISTPKSKEKIVKAITGNVKDLTLGISRYKISGIGIGIAGPLDLSRRIVLNSPRLKDLRKYPLADVLKKELKLKIVMDNDSNCFALAEAVLGAGKGYDLVLGVTLGSGIGGGIISKCKGKSKIFRGRSSAGEIGHMVINKEGSKCSCGNYGCFETEASEIFFKKRGLDSITEEKKAKAGNKRAKKLYLEFSKNLGIGLANLVNILDPDIIVIGGGFSKAGSLILNPLKKEIKSRILSDQSKNVKIVLSKLGEFSGAIGAALLIKKYG